MELFIRIKDGQSFEHPIFADNFVQAFPNIDINNLPSEFARFERVAPPVVGIYQICNTTYELDGTIYKDVHYVRDMTDVEKISKQDKVKADWDEYESWVFNVDACRFESPVPYPQDDKHYYWDESIINWVEVA